MKTIINYTNSLRNLENSKETLKRSNRVLWEFCWKFIQQISELTQNSSNLSWIFKNSYYNQCVTCEDLLKIEESSEGVLENYENSGES